MDYKDAYENEHLKNADLASRIAELEEKNEELEWKLGRIKNNPLWKVSKPFRNILHAAIRQKDRLANCGSLRGIAGKIAYKKREREAMKQFGTESFPEEEQIAKERSARFPRMVKISILVPLWNTPMEFLTEMLDSVVNQTYENWELCLADGSDSEHAQVGDVCRKYIERDLEYLSGHKELAALAGKTEEGKIRSRIQYRKLERNEGISGNTNQCYRMATGEYVGLFDHDDVLHPSVLFEYVRAINEQGADYLYCDETTFQSGDINHMLTMHFKPDYAPDNLRANNYICHFSVFSRKLMDGTELFRTKFDGSQDHDMILRLTDNAEKIVHIPRLLYYWRSHAGSVASGIDAKPYAIQAAKGAVAEHLRKHGFEHFQITSTRAFETIFRIRYEIAGNPKITIVIANKDHRADLERCVSSVLQKSTYENFEIVIVENNSTTQEIQDYYSYLLGYDYSRAASEKAPERKMQREHDGGVLRSCGSDAYDNRVSDRKISVVTYQGEFNYSAVNNLGAAYAEGDYLLLLNNDTEVITVNWMEELLMYAQREDVGAVGCKLFYPDRTIQHAGVVLGLGAHRTAGHSHYKQHRQNLGYMGRLCYAQDVSAVTGACLLVKKNLFDEVGGLEESFAISLNDVDFCLKLREKNLLNVFTPFAELFHYESISRGMDDEGEKAERYNRESEQFRNKWKIMLEKGDPYYNQNFSLDRSDFSLKIV